MNRYSSKGSTRKRKNFLLFLILSLLLHVVLFLLVSLRIPILSDRKLEQKDYIEITELPIPKDKETTPPKKAKLLAERSHKAKEEKTIDKTTRLSKPRSATKVSKPYKESKPSPKKKYQKSAKEKESTTAKKNLPKTVVRKESGDGPSTKKEKTEIASLPRQQASRVEKKFPISKDKSSKIGKDIMKYPFYSETPYDSKRSVFGSDKARKKEDTVDLSTKEFKYISYFTHLKRKIEGVWNYPEESILRGEQGRLFLVFTLNKKGELEDIKLIDSSGYKNLDKEAIRAIKVASPFNPFPKSWELEKLHIRASFEYSFKRFIY